MIGSASRHGPIKVEPSSKRVPHNSARTLLNFPNELFRREPGIVHGPVNRTRGFTLIELTVTLSVAAVFAALAVPAMQQSLQRRQLEGAAREIYGNLMMARSQAIEKNRMAFVSFSSSGANWTYGLNEGTSCNPTVGGSCIFNGTDRVYSSATWRTVSLSQTFTANNLSFEPRRGMTSGSGTIRLSSTVGEIDLSVSPLGYISGCSVGTQHLGGYIPC